MSMSINRNMEPKHRQPKGGGGELPIVQRKIIDVTLQDWPTSSIAAGASTEQTWYLSVQKILAAAGYTVTEDQLTADRAYRNAKLLPTPYTLSFYHPRAEVNSSNHKCDVEDVHIQLGSYHALQTGAATGDNVACVKVNATMHNVSSAAYSPTNITNAARVENLKIEIVVDAIVPAGSGKVGTAISSSTSALTV